MGRISCHYAVMTVHNGLMTQRYASSFMVFTELLKYDIWIHFPSIYVPLSSRELLWKKGLELIKLRDLLHRMLRRLLL